MATKLYINLVGTLRVREPVGAEYTPRGTKARALIGVLTLRSDFRRSRRWIESKHWFDRSDQQARRSLRQTLSEIRKALGADRGAIEADRELVWLRPDRIHVDTVHDVAAARARAAAGRELLQGLSVRDEEFEDWLRAERAILEKAVSLAHRSTRDLVPARLEPAGCRLVVRSAGDLSAAGTLVPQACSEFLGGFFRARLDIGTGPRDPEWPPARRSFRRLTATSRSTPGRLRFRARGRQSADGIWYR